MGASAEHKYPLADGGDLLPSLEDSALSHLKCNREHGGRIGARKSSASQPGTKTNRRTEFLREPSLSPAAPHSFPPKVVGKAGKDPVGPDYHEDGFALPRLETARPARVVGSYGEEAAQWAEENMGLTLYGWQRYALDRALEYGEDGLLVWPLVIITVGRQSGKSVLSRAVCMWRLHHADHFGEAQTILHVANKRNTAMEVMRPAGLWAVNTYGKKAVKWGNTEAGIETPDGNRWLIHAANDNAGVGYSVSMAFLDESWRISKSTYMDAIAPTMAAKISPQAYLVSTAGDSASDLMQTYRQAAIDAMGSDDPDASEILILEWSAPMDADPEDPITWKWGSPEWSEKRENFLRQQWANVELSAFKRQYLNMWVAHADHWLKDSWWAETTSTDELPVSGIWNIAVESDFDGMGHAVAIAATDDQGNVIVRVTTHRTMREVDTQIAKIRREHPSLYILVTPGYVDRLKERFDGLVGQREAAAGTQNLLDLFDRRAIKHDGSQTLLEHFGSSTISRRQQGWVLSAPMGRNGVYAARAVMFAAAQASKTPRPMAMVRSRRRA
ncbi:Terminase large subunit, Lambdalikevirus-type [uncultured Caudovirales phage]|uniref:Terminase large subunit, Lambdalikevirus-type n=1 Tax=uncultured Caudovirales phage TaxID=2100421 RepID=A0A6J5R9B5_9CAUD|nr:Terminase large subunit, Lambdalikevirus-type [uncultured Caudovirales phage]